jgi:hypothetical protein
MATAILLPAPELQFCDADGKPYAGGSVATYVPGTSTPKTTWVDPGETALNTNPIILDAAGRCIIYGSGDYRLILRDAVGNLIYDQLSSTVVSDAMQPVVSAPTIADAVHLLGLDDTVTAAELASAISTEQSARIAADNAETTARTNADNTLQANIDALAATVAGIHGGSGTIPLIQYGQVTVDGAGHAHVTFGTAYAAPAQVVAQCTATAGDVNIASVLVTSTGFDVWVAYPGPGVTPAPGILIYWVAIGAS